MIDELLQSYLQDFPMLCWCGMDARCCRLGCFLQICCVCVCGHFSASELSEHEMPRDGHFIGQDVFEHQMTRCGQAVKDMLLEILWPGPM